jgi:hypothetical protein
MDSHIVYDLEKGNDSLDKNMWNENNGTESFLKFMPLRRFSITSVSPALPPLSTPLLTTCSNQNDARFLSPNTHLSPIPSNTYLNNVYLPSQLHLALPSKDTILTNISSVSNVKKVSTGKIQKSDDSAISEHPNVFMEI